MRHLFLLFLLLLAPLAPLHSAQEPPDAGDIAELRRDAEQGDAEAQYTLGGLYDAGHGVVQDYVEAREWWLKAAQHGYAKAQVNLGFLYANGQGVAQDYVEAMKWYLRAPDQGNTVAQVSLGESYYTGRGVAQDYVEARKWYLKAAQLLRCAASGREIGFSLHGTWHKTKWDESDWASAKKSNQYSFAVSCRSKRLPDGEMLSSG